LSGDPVELHGYHVRGLQGGVGKARAEKRYSQCGNRHQKKRYVHGMTVSFIGPLKNGCSTFAEDGRNHRKEKMPKGGDRDVPRPIKQSPLYGIK